MPAFPKRMTTPSFFKKVISDQNLNAQEILAHLDDLPHLIYLKNNSAPVIAFLPLQFEYVQQGIRHTYQRNDVYE